MKIPVLSRIVFVLLLLLAGSALGKVLAYETFPIETMPDILIADFEGDDYGEWEVTGEAFGPGPASGTLPNQMGVGGFQGSGLVNSFYGGDASTGTLTSPAFTIERPYLNFLIGGGGHVGQTCMNLIHNGQVVRSAVGPNTEPGGSESLDWKSWYVADLMGESVTLQIVDQHSGGWGHINVDHIIQSRVKREPLLDYDREMVFESRYLNLPVKNGAAKRWITLFVGDEKVREFEIELATEEPDFWVFLDISEFHGQTGVLRIDRYWPTSQSGFDAIFQDDSFPGQENLYREKRRPQFHFSTRRGWINDANGMVYYDGVYHLFYQHNPYGWDWGNMTWGHAVSSDMLHWRELPDAIHPDELGTIFSGSAVVDEGNTSGFQAGSEKPLVAFYTSAGGSSRWSQGQPFTQSLAYSNDAGMSWTKYEDNPVIGHIVGGNRDPKVFWHEPTGKWCTVLFLDGHTMAFFTSPDLKNWTETSRLESFYECPELFELPVDGDSGNRKWVLYGADGAYFVGDFNGREFTPDGPAIRFHHGNCFYASQTFNNIPESDGRRIQMAWGRVAMPEMPFNQMMLFPVSLTLHTTAEGVRMSVNPIAEIAGLHGQHWSWSSQEIGAGQNPLAVVEGELFHIEAQLDPQDADSIALVIRGTPLTYDAGAGQLSIAGQSAPLPLENGKVRLEILVDRMSIEVYGNGGRVYMPIGVDLVDRARSIELLSNGGDIRIDKLDVYELGSAWNTGE